MSLADIQAMKALKLVKQKGDKTYVDSELAKKVNTTDLFDTVAAKNKYNPTTVTDNFFMQTNGTTASSTNFKYTDFISVKTGDIVVFSCLSGGNRTPYSMRFVAAYDANKVAVTASGLSNPATSYTVPIGISYIICTVNKTVTNTDIQIEITSDGALTVYAPYSAVLQLKPGLASSLDIVSSLINVPSKIRELTTLETSIFYENIINKSALKDIAFTVGEGTQSDKRYFGTLTADRSLLIELFKDGQKLSEKSSTIVIKNPSTVTTNYKVHFIGDSTTGNIADQTNASFSADGFSTATFIGTKQTGSTSHDGRAGWSTDSYVNKSSQSGVANDFFNSTSNKFDYSYFMQQKGYTAPSHVVFVLGINDISTIKTDDTLKTAVATTLSNFDFMINSIKTYKSTIKICLGIPVPPNVSQEQFWLMYSTQQWRYKRNYDYFVSEFIKKYDNREAESLYLIPMNLSLDTTVDIADAVHPVYSTGSKKAGQQVYKTLKVIG